MRFLCSISLTHSFLLLLTLGAFFPLPLDIEEVSIMRSGSATRERETFDQIHFHKFRTPGHGKILYGMEKISEAKRSKKTRLFIRKCVQQMDKQGSPIWSPPERGSMVHYSPRTRTSPLPRAVFSLVFAMSMSNYRQVR